jgi:hypothetical protein
VLLVDRLVPPMGSGVVGTVDSSLARSKVVSGSVFVLPPLFSGVSVLVCSSIGTYADSSPLPELFSGLDPNNVLPVEVVILAKGSGGVGVVGSPPAKPKDAGGSVFVLPPPFPSVPIPASSYPQPELASRSNPADFQPLLEIALGPEAPLVSADKASMVSSEAVIVWASWVLRVPFLVVLCHVLCSMSPFLVLRAIQRILWWLSRLLTPLPHLLTWAKGVVWNWICFRRRSLLLCLTVQQTSLGESLGSGLQIGYCSWFKSSVTWWGFRVMVSKDGFRHCLRIL